MPPLIAWDAFLNDCRGKLSNCGNDEVEEDGFKYRVRLPPKHGEVLPQKIDMMLS